ncbi:MAG TPA: TonB-dependent receptor, partial [Pseudomonadota bacterium]|nr:TonB-dependent receptor [Pseudomonadota bacterium]
KARRNYDALVLTLNKRLSNRFSIISSYTYSRTIGNYPGTFSSSNGQLDPNISSQFDLIDLLANRNGPLPTDRPHNFKATAFYDQPLFGDKGKLTIGLTFTATSGRPIEVLGRHPYYGRREVYILPRGSGGRTPMVTQFDLHVGYDHKLTQTVGMNLFIDVVNLFNQQEVTNVDDEFTATTVSPIVNGQLTDLKHLKANNGTLPTFNSNYGQPTSYQLPLYMRFGWRLTF